MTDLELLETPEGLRVRVKVVPRSRSPGIEGIHGAALKVRIQSPPVDGKANAELLRVLSREFGLRPDQVTMTAGETSRTKSIVLAGCDAASFRESLQRILVERDEKRSKSR